MQLHVAEKVLKVPPVQIHGTDRWLRFPSFPPNLHHSPGGAPGACFPHTAVGKGPKDIERLPSGLGSGSFWPFHITRSSCRGVRGGLTSESVASWLQHLRYPNQVVEEDHKDTFLLALLLGLHRFYVSHLLIFPPDCHHYFFLKHVVPRH